MNTQNEVASCRVAGEAAGGGRRAARARIHDDNDEISVNELRAESSRDVGQVSALFPRTFFFFPPWNERRRATRKGI